MDDNGNETWWMKTEDKEAEFDRDFLREDTEEREEANDVKKKEEETSLASDMVEKRTEEKLRGCERMSDKSEVKKCENDEILKRKVCESIDETKEKGFCAKEQKKNEEKR